MNWFKVLEAAYPYFWLVPMFMVGAVTAPGLGCWLGQFVVWGKVEGIRRCWGCDGYVWPGRRLFRRRLP